MASDIAGPAPTDPGGSRGAAQMEAGGRYDEKTGSGYELLNFQWSVRLSDGPWGFTGLRRNKKMRSDFSGGPKSKSQGTVCEL